jgi:2-hydroxycyclohexanecarboxyl-CoA dehydrogenase
MTPPAASGRVAFVSGGGRGIGREICRALAAQGRAVAVGDVLIDEARATAAAIRDDGGTAEAVFLDVTNTASVGAAVDEAQAALGAVEILVNNVGWDEMLPFVKTDEAFLTKVLDVNLKGAMRLTRQVLPGMLEGKWGRIVNISSDAGRVGSLHQVVYSTAKGGLIAFTKSIAREGARDGVTANAVCPGPTRTPLIDEMFEGERRDRALQALAQASLMNRLAEPEEIASAVAFFTTETAGFITGQTLSVSGGLTMAG